MRRPPAWLGGIIVAAIAAAGWSGAQVVGSSPYTSTDTVTTRALSVVTSTRTVRRVVRGHVVTLPGGTRVVHVPVLIVRTDHRTIRVPAQTLPVRGNGGGLTAAVDVPVTVTIRVPIVSTVYVPVTVTSVTTTTETILSTTTLLPDPVGDARP